MYKRILVLFALCFVVFSAKAQQDVFVSYSSLNLRSSAKVAALGMDFLPWYTNDIGVGITNPSILNKDMDNQFAFGFTDLFAGIWQGNLAVSKTFNRLGSFSFGLNYIGYGDFKRTLPNGDEIGNFSANDYMFTIGWAKKLEDNLFMGVNMKPIISQYDSYSSFAIAFDLAATYIYEKQDLTATLMARNFGAQIKTFNNIKEELPFELQLGLSKKLTHAPFRVFLLVNNLNKWDLRENDPLNPRDRIDPFTGEITRENSFKAFLDNSFRHLEFGLDFQPSKLFNIALGYSWKQSREMYLNDALSLAGFSYGFGINIKKFSLSFARNEYHKFGSPNHLTLIVKI